MTFGGQTTYEDSAAQIRAAIDAAKPNKAILDTARLYRGGKVEALLGRLFASEPQLRAQVSVHTKADPNITPLHLVGLTSQLTRSLEELGCSSVDVFYLHMPDISIPLEETLEACNLLHEKGKFVELGLSNYPAWEVVRAFHVCKARGWIAPSVYQGVYHILSRDIEYELAPAIRTLGIRLHVFSPLCGGLLSERYRDVSERPSTGRFSPEYHNHTLYLERYFHEGNFQALALLRTEAARHGIPLAEVALRFLCFHSVMRPGDGIVFGGGAGVERARANLACVRKGPLPQELVQLIDGPVAELVYAKQAKYFRGYSAVHGRSDKYLARF